jgi:hypothetical protein
MNAQQLYSSLVPNSIDNSSMSGYMAFIQQAAITSRQTANETDDQLYAILWDNVYSGQ